MGVFFIKMSFTIFKALIFCLLKFSLNFIIVVLQLLFSKLSRVWYVRLEAVLLFY